MFWSFVMLARHSAKVGIGREFGRARGGRDGGSRKIWCETLLCLYLWPRLWPMFCLWEGDKSASLRCTGGLKKILGVPRTDLITGDFASVEGWKLKGPASSPLPTSIA